MQYLYFYLNVKNNQMQIDHSSGIPLHIQVEKLLRELIDSSKYKNGELLPKEVDLANRLGISRNTVRKSISKLVMEGLLERKKGIGTKVSEKKITTQLKSWMSFTQEMNSKGIAFINYETIIEEVEAPLEVSNALEIKKNTKVFKLSRLRGTENGPFVYFISWLHPRIGLTGKEDFKRPLYEILEKDFSILVYLSREDISAILASKEISDKLQINSSDPVLKRVRKVYDPGKRPIEYTNGYYRADKFTYGIDIEKELE